MISPKDHALCASATDQERSLASQLIAAACDDDGAWERMYGLAPLYICHACSILRNAQRLSALVEALENGGGLRQCRN
jgi:hypothetical protein